MSLGSSRKISTGLAIFLTLVFSFMGAAAAHAQVTGATLTGTVTDPAGAVVAGAQISIKNIATSINRDTTSDSAGLYTVPNLDPGTYEVRVSATGFSTVVQSNLLLSVGQQQQINFSLKLGDYNETVAVSEA